MALGRSIWNWFLTTLSSRTFWMIISLIVGIGAYIWGAFLPQSSLLHEILFQIGNITVIGIFFSFFSNASEFLGIFKKELQDIVYSDEFLNDQKDVSKYWKTTSKQMFKNKFPDIHEEFLDVINANLPTDEVSYYKDYEMTSTMKWIDEDKGIVKVNDCVDFYLIADSEEKFIYPLKNWIKTSADGSEIKSKMLSFIVNKKEMVSSDGTKPKPQITCKDGERCEEYDIALKGSKQYHIVYQIEKEYNLFDDHCKGFRAKYIVNNCRLNLEVPTNVHVQFVARGTLREFLDKGIQTPHKISKEYKGILLPKQGFIVAFMKTKTEKQH